MLEEDRRLRARGHPQAHIYMFRSAGLSHVTMSQLPVPWYTDDGHVVDSYWQALEELGIPPDALPARYTGRSNRFSAREEELRIFASQASRSFTFSTPNKSHSGAPADSFSARFGSPVRPLNFSIPNTPATPRSLPASGRSSFVPPLFNPFEASPTQPPNTPLGGQQPKESSDVQYCDHVEFAIPGVYRVLYRVHGRASAHSSPMLNYVWFCKPSPSQTNSSRRH